MRIQIQGTCGDFMGGIALFARELGHTVTGSDSNVYPPMSTQLEEKGINLMEGYDAKHLDPSPDLVIIGNTLSRGNASVEYVLNRGFRFMSGPQWLHEYVLPEKHVLAVSGTHGKTTTTSILAWILQASGYTAGFLVGGVAENFGCSARLGDAKYFVVEADEYDTAFFDKRSKFIHYHPKTLIINNIEFDHADIFADINAIKREFHHLVRTISNNGLIIAHSNDTEINEMLNMGCWTPVDYYAGEDAKWKINPKKEDYSEFEILMNEKVCGVGTWPLIGRHNAENALAAIAAAQHIGISPDKASESLSGFKNVKRRLEKLAVVDGITVYDDFAHHPTAIRATLAALRLNVGNHRIFALLEPRSNTMRQGIHKDEIACSLEEADHSLLFQPKGLSWDLSESTRNLGDRREVFSDIESLIRKTVKLVHADDHIVIMSNGGFENIHQRLIKCLQEV